MIVNILLFLGLTGQVGAPGGDPDLSWRTLETEHFFIHYPTELEKGAHRVAVRAEVVYSKRTSTFRWDPQGKVHIVLSDPSDSPNGLSTPLPYNTIYLYGAPPIDDSALDDYDDWLHTLIAHEFTHTVHLDMAKGFVNKALRLLFGRFWLPNAPQQQWAHEGLAMLYETLDTTRGRGRSSLMQMFLRTVSLEDRFVGIDRATYWNDQYPYGNTAYWYGIGFYQYLMSKYGEAKVIDFVHATASSPVPGFMNFKTDSVFGKSLHRLWQEWKFEEKEKWTIFKNENESHFKSKVPDSKQAWILNGQPTWDAEKRILYAPVRRDRENSIQAFQFDSNANLTSKKVKAGTAAKLHFYDGKLIYSESKSESEFRNYSDVIVYDIKLEKEFRITKGLRVRDPIVYRDRLIGIRTDAFESSIVSLPWKKVIEAIQSEQPIASKSELEVLYKAEGYNALSKPEGSPARNEIVFSMKKENGNRDLYLLNLESKDLAQLTNDYFDDHHPVFSVDGSKVYFSSDHFFGKSDVQIPNIFAVDRENKVIQQVTDSLTGASFPLLAASNLFIGVFHSEGYELEWTTFEPKQATSLQERQPESQKPQLFDDSKPFTSTAYRFGNALLPRYIVPLFLYTETDSLLGAQTGSRDPLGFHNWSLFGFQLFGPNRPGGSAVYQYSGWSPADLFVSGFAGISNYGRIILKTNALNQIVVDPDDYYERSYGASAGFSSQIRTKDGPTGLSVSGAGFYEYRNSLFGFPEGALRGAGTDSSGNIVRLSPEIGHQWGGRFGLRYAHGLQAYPDGISPYSGQILSLSVEYSPKGLGSDFSQLTTILSGKAFLQLFGDHIVAFRAVAGAQWLDSLYQRSFLVGGSLGESPFSSLNRRSYPFRGLPASDLRGEGLSLGSIEYRFPLTKKLPGIGTAPLWFKNLHAALFSDAAQTFNVRDDTIMLIETVPGREVEDFKWNRFSLSVGAEIRSDTSLVYAPPLTYRLGYGYVLYRKGEYLGNKRIDEIYFQAGASF